MKRVLAYLWDIGRSFRFWSYLSGTFVIGYTVGIETMSQWLQPYFFIHLLYFLFPANIFLYGINDFFDSDTDIYNKKKQQQERLMNESDRKLLKGILIGCILLSGILVWFEQTMVEQLLIFTFLVLSYAYSSPPFRFKSKPVIDFSSNILYILPGILGYYHFRHQFPDLYIWIPLFCWTSAMHLFSAIPDIEADTQAGLKTSAVVFGRVYSLVVCCIFWMIFAWILQYQPHLYPLNIFFWAYALIPLVLLFLNSRFVNIIYWYYPYMNLLFGFTTFLYIASQKSYV